MVMTASEHAERAIECEATATDFDNNLDIDDRHLLLEAAKLHSYMHRTLSMSAGIGPSEDEDDRP